MAINSSSYSTRALLSSAKRFISQIFYQTPLSIRRGVHVSVYDKNPDDKVRATVVPDEVIQPLSDKYWGPNPKTGVFGPAAEQNPAEHGEGEDANSGESVLEQKAFFRPQEDLEKPEPRP